ncbi:hypothetical protein PCANC_02839 [Puccinia coronata f. sp. avenae]|uniref:Uncharacterized protein n=1 Tax=Puccinia coronata f. sp. avenae TaxID=200324 RepID=A0A2N5SRM0_9BASI|nr:hypothetical protein PCANC_14264 [Puccinia coronata f. sp. avenae]PLW42264.1 hypothetical protein PCASD_07734 [Puccinia coronata f. sp. avenae]PLW56958.1 hypothetical protein PCANC_02839 [Puccinia coronata f. sp. avenae]
MLPAATCCIRAPQGDASALAIKISDSQFNTSTDLNQLALTLTECILCNRNPGVLNPASRSVHILTSCAIGFATLHHEFPFSHLSGNIQQPVLNDE